VPAFGPGNASGNKFRGNRIDASVQVNACDFAPRGQGGKQEENAKRNASESVCKW